MKRTIRSILWLLTPILLVACTTPPRAPVNYPAPIPPPPAAAQPPAPSPPPPPAEPAPAPAPVIDTSANDRALATAFSAYDRGNYAQAVRLLTPLTTDSTLEAEQRLRALKTLAFAQCSTNALTACRQTFERAFRADPHFDLAAAERGHPIWGPQFDRARKAVTGR